MQKKKLTNKDKHKLEEVIKMILLMLCAIAGFTSCSSTYSVSVHQSQPDQEQNTTITTTTEIKGYRM